MSSTFMLSVVTQHNFVSSLYFRFSLSYQNLYIINLLISKPDKTKLTILFINIFIFLFLWLIQFSEKKICFMTV